MGILLEASNVPTLYTTITLRSCLRRERSSANADPITFLSAHKDPVGMLTSMFVPLYSFGLCPGFCTNNTASTGFLVFLNQNDDKSVSIVLSS